MKILIVTKTLSEKDGQGRYGLGLIDGLVNKYNLTIISSDIGYGQDFSSTVKVIKAPDLSKGFKIFRYFKFFLLIKKYLKFCDIIHAIDGYPFGVLSTMANMWYKRKFIITVIGTYSVLPLYNLKTAIVLTWAYKKANKIVAISNYTKNEILKKLKLKNINIINPGIDFKKFYKKRKACDKFFILSVGSLKERKGLHIAIPSFAKAREKIKNLEYIIVGNQDDKKYFNRLKKLAIKYKVADKISFLNNLSDKELSNLYSQAKLFIMPSINIKYNFEGFGLVFLEAAAAGLPVVGTINNGISDAVADNGILVDQKNIKQTTEAIVSILNNKDKWQKMSDNSYFWSERHNLSKVIKQYIKVYDSKV